MGNNFTVMKLFKPKRFKPNSVILITGASSGIGRTLALMYAARGVRLALASRNESALNQVATQCRRLGSKALVVKCDVSLEEDCSNLMRSVIDTYGELDILILSAGITSHQYFEEIQDLQIFHQVMKTNFYGAVYITQYALPHLRRTKGRIVVLSSFSGEVGLPTRTAYCSSKFALTGFFEALRMETAPRRMIDICIICPPSVKTNFRKNAIGSSAQATKDLNKYNMTLDECCRHIMEAIDRRARKVFFPFKAYMAVYIRPIFPDLVDKILRGKANL